MEYPSLLDCLFYLSLRSNDNLVKLPSMLYNIWCNKAEKSFAVVVTLVTLWQLTNPAKGFHFIPASMLCPYGAGVVNHRDLSTIIPN